MWFLYWHVAFHKSSGEKQTKAEESSVCLEAMLEIVLTALLYEHFLKSLGTAKRGQPLDTQKSHFEKMWRVDFEVMLENEWGSGEQM